MIYDPTSFVSTCEWEQNSPKQNLHCWSGVCSIQDTNVPMESESLEKFYAVMGGKIICVDILNIKYNVIFLSWWSPKISQEETRDRKVRQWPLTLPVQTWVLWRVKRSLWPTSEGSEGQGYWLTPKLTALLILFHRPDNMASAAFFFHNLHILGSLQGKLFYLKKSSHWSIVRTWIKAEGSIRTSRTGYSKPCWQE